MREAAVVNDDGEIKKLCLSDRCWLCNNSKSKQSPSWAQSPLGRRWSPFP